jgi:hypothetical protein
LAASEAADRISPEYRRIGLAVIRTGQFFPVQA